MTMTPYEYVKNHVNVKLSPSKIHGVGIFAIRDIEENEESEEVFEIIPKKRNKIMK